MWEVIRKNKIKSVIALCVMTVWYSIIYGLICAFFVNVFAMKIELCEDFSPVFIPVGVAIALLIFIVRFVLIKGKPYEINMYSLCKTNRTKHKQLYNVVEEMAVASGIKKIPKIYILNCDILNAYACGFSPENSSIVVSKKLLEILSREELQGVIAHEMSHIINRDTTYLLCSGALYAISAAFTLFFYEGMRSRGKGAAACLIMLLLSLLGQAICFLLFMFISRKREYLADASAARYTRYPKGLADALLKIEKGYSNETIETDNLVKASFIAPLKKKDDSLTSTHPSTENRIKVLMNMTSADYQEYEKQFEKLNNKNLIPKSALKKSNKIEIKQVEESQQNVAVMGACALNLKAKDEQIKLIRENKEVLNQNIQKHREVENFVRDLAGYKVINCECGTSLKIPPVYNNQIIICPHCKKKHAVK